MFVARQSDNIKEDLKRNWSSWNYGQGGFTGTRQALDKYLGSATESSPVFLSEFELYPSDIKRIKVGELYANYWVVVDDRGGLSCNKMKQDNLDDAIKFLSANPAFCGGDGSFVDCSDAEVVWSNGDLHILEVED